jgi:serine protease Do
MCFKAHKREHMTIKQKVQRRFWACVVCGSSVGSLDLSAQKLRSQSLVAAIKQVASGVVNIRTKDIPDPNRPSHPSAAALDKFFLQMMLPSSLLNSGGPRSLGSGFLLDGKGYILTNYHVIQESLEIEVQWKDPGKTAIAQLVSFDKANDLAVLKIRPQEVGYLGLKPVALENSALVEVGESVFAIGNPFGYGTSVSSGIISAKDRSIGIGPLDQYLQTDAPINPGNSGGPLFNMSGKVIGITTAIHGEGYGISFALPSNIIRQKWSQLTRIQDTVVPIKIGFIGKSLREIWEESKKKSEAHPDSLKSSDLSLFGVLVEKTFPDSLAQEIGLLQGDIILACNGKRVDTGDSLREQLKHLKLSNEISFRVKRGVLVMDLMRKTKDSLGKQNHSNSLFPSDSAYLSRDKEMQFY